jgi:hypothetical protein
MTSAQADAASCGAWEAGRSDRFAVGKMEEAFENLTKAEDVMMICDNALKR